MQTVIGLFDKYENATAAVFRLENYGVPREEISIVASNADHWYSTPTKASTSTDASAETGAGLGAVAGGASGLLAGLGLIAIPGIGPVVAAGWLVSAAAGIAAGAVLGGATGGLIGALTSSGVSERDANFYVEGVRSGGTLVTARVSDELAPGVREILHTDRVDPETDKAADVPRQDEFDEKAGFYSAIPDERRKQASRP